MSDYDDANFLSKITFFWVIKYVRNRLSRPIIMHDISKSPSSTATLNVYKKYENAWKKAISQKKFNLFLTIFSIFKLDVFILMIISLLLLCIMLAKPLLTSLLIKNLKDIHTKEGLAEIISKVCYLVAAITAELILRNNYFWRTYDAGLRLKTLISYIVYLKIMTLKQSSLTHLSIGAIFNYMSTDVQKYEYTFDFLHYTWICFLTIIIITGIVYEYIGKHVILPLLSIFIMCFFQGVSGQIYGLVKTRLTKHTDQRIKVVSNVINGIRAIKMYSWGDHFAKKVTKIRQDEQECLQSNSLINSYLFSQFDHQTKLAIMIFLVSYFYIPTLNRDFQLNGESLFLVIGLFFSLYNMSTVFVAGAFENMSQTYVSSKRIQNLLTYDTLDGVTGEGGPKKGIREIVDEKVLVIDNLSASWSNQFSSPVISNISVKIEGNKLVGIVGSVGSGKTSLIMAILDELLINKGSIKNSKTISYQSQVPWIFPGTIRENIIFNQEYDKERFARVVKATAMDYDLSLMKNGEFTMVGERGLCLSGGQKTRLALARAIYMKSDMIIFDDPLAAVDTVTSKRLFKSCIQEFCSDRLVLLVTNQMHILPEFDEIIVMKKGKLIGYGLYEDLLKENVQFEQIIEPEVDASSQTQKRDSITIEKVEKTFELDDELSELPEEVEAITMGSISLKTYGRYFMSGSGFFGIFVIVSMAVLTITLYFINDFWIAKWANRMDANFYSINGTVTGEEWFPSDANSMRILICLTMGLTIGSVVRSLAFFRLLVKSNTNLHNKMFNALLNAKMSFFVSNSSGRILNKFSNDMGVIDDYLQLYLHDLVICSLMTLEYGVTVVLVNPYILLAGVPLLMLFYFLLRMYLLLTRDLIRLESISKGPILTQISSTIQGLPLIRTFNMEQPLIDKMCSNIDDLNKIGFLRMACYRWLSIILDIGCVLFSTTVMALSITLAYFTDVKSGDIGIAITSINGLIGLLQWSVNCCALVDCQMVSVERVMELCDLSPEESSDPQPQEPTVEYLKRRTSHLIFKSDLVEQIRLKVPENFLTDGRIEFENVSFRYNPEGDYVLKNINLIIEPGKKVGVVGRTGAGKSTLLSSLFRLMNITEGRIIIDGTDIGHLPLKDLRSAMSIIPQEPIMFTGTIRENLDPLSKYSDQDIIKSLETVELGEFVRSSPQGLNYEISEEGGNLSLGQRQLICLARVILKNSRILCIDEATANVDPQTDSIIQKTICTEFVNSTVLTIAHRLETIINSDLVVVMEAGQVAEFDHPYNLLRNMDQPSGQQSAEIGYFEHLVRETGEANGRKLLEIAKKSFNNRSF